MVCGDHVKIENPSVFIHIGNSDSVSVNDRGYHYDWKS